jgi:hypothetical protein
LQKGGIPLFGIEGLGEISGGACLANYGLLSNHRYSVESKASKYLFPSDSISSFSVKAAMGKKEEG